MKRVMVIYHSQEHGNTAACAELVARGLREAGVDVELVNTNEVNRVDVARMAASDGLAIGSPDYYSYVAGTIKQLFDDIYVAGRAGLSLKGKPCALFMTHGGGGAGVRALKELSRGLRLVAEPFVCPGAPPADCPGAVELGRKLAQAL